MAPLVCVSTWERLEVPLISATRRISRTAPSCTFHICPDCPHTSRICCTVRALGRCNDPAPSNCHRVCVASAIGAAAASGSSRSWSPSALDSRRSFWTLDRCADEAPSPSSSRIIDRYLTLPVHADGSSPRTPVFRLRSRDPAWWDPGRHSDWRPSSWHSSGSARRSASRLPEIWSFREEHATRNFKIQNVRGTTVASDANTPGLDETTVKTNNESGNERMIDGRGYPHSLRDVNGMSLFGLVALLLRLFLPFLAVTRICVYIPCAFHFETEI